MGSFAVNTIVGGATGVITAGAGSAGTAIVSNFALKGGGKIATMAAT